MPYRRNNNKYVNPYNFVSIDEMVERKDFLAVENDVLSGVLTCTLETLTPLFMPNTTNEYTFSLKPETDAQKKLFPSKSFDFYSYEIGRAHV